MASVGLRPEGDTARLLRRRGYPSFLATTILSRSSGAMFNVAGVLLVLERTHSAPLAGAVAAAIVIPGAVLGPLLGAWLDTVSFRRLLMAGDQLLSVISLALLLALAGHAPNWTVPAVAVLYSVTRPFTVGGNYAAMAELAGAELSDRASMFDATSLNLAVVGGPALAGLLAGLVGAPVTVGVQAGLTLLAAVLILLNPAYDAAPAHASPGFGVAVRTGMRLLVRTPGLRAVVIGSALSSAAWGAMVIGFPLYATQILGGRTHDAGYLWAALGIGSIVGTFAIRGAPSLRRSSASYAALGLSALLWPLVHALALGVLLVGVSGVIEGPAFSSAVALRQREVPAAVRAQVSTTVVGFVGLMVSAGSILGGAVADPRALVDVFVALNVLAALATAFPGGRGEGGRQGRGEGGRPGEHGASEPA